MDTLALALSKWLATDSPHNGLEPSNILAMLGTLKKTGK